MAETIRLTVLTGPHRGRRFCFRGRATCEVGRAPDCFVCLAGTARDQLISRHHCRLDLDPPCVRIEDLHSYNGTYVNGRAVPGDTVKDIASVFDGAPPTATVNDGDVVTVGGTSFRVDIMDCPPRSAEGAGHEAVWGPGEVAKKDCPIPC